MSRTTPHETTFKTTYLSKTYAAFFAFLQKSRIIFHIHGIPVVSFIHIYRIYNILLLHYLTFIFLLLGD